MTTYKSKTSVNMPKEKVFEQIADMRRLEKYREGFPLEISREMEFFQEHINIKTQQFGLVTIRLAEKEEQKKLTFALENFPIKADFYINLDEIQSEKTEIQLILEADIPFFIRPVLNEKLQAGIDKAAELLAIALNE